METDRGVALLHSARDSLICRVPAGRYRQHVACTECGAVTHVVQELCIFGGYAKNITWMPVSTTQMPGSSVTEALKSRSSGHVPLLLQVASYPLGQGKPLLCAL